MTRQSSDSDERLWTLIAAGDSDAFSLIFDRHADSVYRYVLQRSGNWSVAEDVVAMTFLETWRKRGSVVLSGDSALPWLLGVATNTMRNVVRARRRYDEALERVAGTRPAPDWDESEVVDRLDAESVSQALREAVGRLPKGQQDVVWLCFVDGLTYHEASIALRIPVGTVRSRLSRAGAALRRSRQLELFSSSGHDIDEMQEPTPDQKREAE